MSIDLQINEVRRWALAKKQFLKTELLFPNLTWQINDPADLELESDRV